MLVGLAGHESNPNATARNHHLRQT